MSALSVALVVASIALNASASILLKLASRSWTLSLNEVTAKIIVLNGAVVVCYLAAFVTYGLALKHMPISKAYILITAGTQAVLLIAGISFLGEKYSLLSWLGLVLIVAGVSLLALGMVENT